jgi:hypothetical protein
MLFTQENVSVSQLVYSRKDAKAQRKRKDDQIILCGFLCAFASLRE